MSDKHREDVRKALRGMTRQELEHLRGIITELQDKPKERKHEVGRSAKKAQ